MFLPPFLVPPSLPLFVCSFLTPFLVPPLFQVPPFLPFSSLPPSLPLFVWCIWKHVFIYVLIFADPAIVWGRGSLNFIVPLNSSIDLECRASIVPESEISLELSTIYSKTTIIPDGKNVIQRGNIFTIRKVDRDKRGVVFCKTTSQCGGQATGYKIGRLLPVLPTGK